LPEPKASKPVVAATARDARALKAGASKEAAAERRRQRESGAEDAVDDEEEGVAADVNLREAERVLLDLLELSSSRGGSTVTAGVHQGR
jgi:hypothetical protein